MSALGSSALSLGFRVAIFGAYAWSQGWLESL